MPRPRSFCCIELRYRHSPRCSTRKSCARAEHAFPKVRTRLPRRAQTGAYSRVQTRSGRSDWGGRLRHSPGWIGRQPSARAVQALPKVRCRSPRTAQTGSYCCVQNCGRSGRGGVGRTGPSSTTTVQLVMMNAAAERTDSRIVLEISDNAHSLRKSPIMPNRRQACRFQISAIVPEVHDQESRWLTLPYVLARHRLSAWS